MIKNKYRFTTGVRGCCATTHRKGKERFCAQLAINWTVDGKGYCYYHNPEAPRKFGEGYGGRRLASPDAGAKGGEG